MEKKSRAFLDPETKTRLPNANLRAKTRWKKAMQAERELKKCLRTSGASFAASQDQAVELAFNEMRNAICKSSKSSKSSMSRPSGRASLQ